MSYYWIVKMSDGKEYQLSEAQYEVLLKAKAANEKMVVFDRFTIGLSYIQYMNRHKEEEFPELPK